VTCGTQPDIPPDVSRSFSGDVEGKAQLFTKLLGDLDLKGKIDESKNEVYQKYKNVDKSKIDIYIAWVSCQNIMSDQNLTASQKAKLWIDVYREIMSGGQHGATDLPKPSDLNVIVEFNQADLVCPVKKKSILPRSSADSEKIIPCWSTEIILKNINDEIKMKNIKVRFIIYYADLIDDPTSADFRLSPRLNYEVINSGKDSALVDMIGFYGLSQLDPLEDSRVTIFTHYRIRELSFRISAEGFSNTWEALCGKDEDECKQTYEVQKSIATLKMAE
jgi:hypothetical protein